MGFSIKRRLLIGLLSITAVVILIATIKNYFDTRHEIEQLFDAQLVQAARSLLALSDHELHEQMAFLSHSSDLNSSLNEPIPIQVHKYEQSIEFQIWLVEQKFLAVRTDSTPDSPLTHEENTFTDIVYNGTHRRVYAISNDEHTIQVQVAENYAERDRLSNSIALRLMLSLAIILPLLAILISVIVTRTVEPLNRIAREIEMRRGDDLHPVAGQDVPNEAKPMITALNHLFDRLRVAFDNIGRFTADAAHELRTPLAALKVNSQVALNANDENVRKEALTDMVSSVNSATSLVEQLLMLARLDPEGLIRNEQTELYEVAEEVIADMATEAIKKNIDIGLDAKSRVFVIGKSPMLAILIRNLIQNAIRYTPKNGVIDIIIWQGESGSCLRIADSGPGIPANERDDVFRRFYRRPGSDAPGTGLGLSIVKRIVEIHQAAISMDKSVLGGLQVDIWFTSSKKLEPIEESTIRNQVQSLSGS